MKGISGVEGTDDLSGPFDRSVTALADAYRYGLLDVQSEERSAHNDRLLGARTLGIEVTVPELAARCGLGNIDPQHTGGDSSRTAIEAALDVTPPPRGSRLVTVREDADAIGAMAVLAFRCANGCLSAGMRGRVDAIARSDRFDYGPWPGVRPLPGSVEDLDAAPFGAPALAAIRGACFDTRKATADKVAILLSWLLRGIEPETYRAAWRTRQQELLDALDKGEVLLETHSRGRIAVVETSRDDALRVAYHLAPVVVARKPHFRWRGKGEPHTRYAVTQWEPGWIDLVRVRDDLARREYGWGGSATFIASPQGIGSQIALADILDVAERHLLTAPLSEERRS